MICLYSNFNQIQSQYSDSSSISDRPCPLIQQSEFRRIADCQAPQKQRSTAIKAPPVKLFWHHSKLLRLQTSKLPFAIFQIVELLETREMPEGSTPTMLPTELTLVLAATRNMGIGRAGGLPWTGLKKEMAYFARVTKRLPSEVGNRIRDVLL